MSRYDEIEETAIAKTFDEVLKFNPYHGADGRFSNSHGAASFTVRTRDPAKQHWADKAKLREQERQVKILEQKISDIDDEQDKILDGIWDKDRFLSLGAERRKLEAELDETKKPVSTKENVSGETKNPDSAPKEFKTPTRSEVNDMAEEMGQTRDQMSTEDYNTMTGWSGYFQTGNSFDLNEKLRNGKPLSDKNKKVVDALDRNMKPSTKDIQVNRMVGESFLRDQLGIHSDADLQKAVGKVTVCKAYSSTSYDMSENVFSSRNVSLKINAPKGTKMLISPTGEEAEILLGRNTAMKINGIKTSTNGWGQKTYTIDVHVIVD